jgi:hypothetical protein
MGARPLSRARCFVAVARNEPAGVHPAERATVLGRVSGALRTCEKTPAYYDRPQTSAAALSYLLLMLVVPAVGILDTDSLLWGDAINSHG